MAKKKKIPVLAVILSLIFPGLGQAYAGKFDRGLIVAAAALIVCLLSMFLFVAVGGFVPTVSELAPWYIRYAVYDFIWMWVFVGVVYVWVMVDAWRSCKK